MNCPICNAPINDFTHYYQFEGYYCSTAYCVACDIIYTGTDVEADGEGDKDAIHMAEKSLEKNMGNIKRKFEEQK